MCVHMYRYICCAWLLNQHVPIYMYIACSKMLVKRATVECKMFACFLPQVSLLLLLPPPPPLPAPPSLPPPLHHPGLHLHSTLHLHPELAASVPHHSQCGAGYCPEQSGVLTGQYLLPTAGGGEKERGRWRARIGE